MSDRSHPCIQAAETWLRKVLAEVREGAAYAETEAVVYFRSRGEECSAEAAAIRDMWVRHAEAECASAEQGRLAKPPGTRQRRQGAVRSHQGNVPSPPVHQFLPEAGFWYKHVLDDEEDTVLVTLLRTVEWCEIRGFDAWWSDAARGFLTGLSPGIDAQAGAFWVGQVGRSRLATSTFGTAVPLIVTLLSHEPRPAWMCLDETGLRASPFHAAALLFAASQNATAFENWRQRDEATDVLVRTQTSDGWWPVLEGRSRASLLATAMAVHALRLGSTARSRALSDASRWMISAQNDSGSWGSPGEGEVFTTVLVLDALSLAGIGSGLTFRLADPGDDTVRSDAIPAKPSPEGKLNGMEQNILIALWEGQHISESACIAADALSKAAGYGASASGTFKLHVAGLVRRNYLQSRTGRGGGVWLAAGALPAAEGLARNCTD